MKEIGEKLREARESIGISIEEAAEDLKLNVEQIQNIEDGKVEAFQDIFDLKYFIRDYAKYLGLDKEELVDEFNEYLFDYTSKLSLDDIKKEVKAKKEDSHKIHSPYTIERKNDRWLQIITYITIVVLLCTIGYLLFTMMRPSDSDDNNVVAYIGGTYEFTK